MMAASQELLWERKKRAPVQSRGKLKFLCEVKEIIKDNISNPRKFYGLQFLKDVFSDKRADQPVAALFIDAFHRPLDDAP